jgi:hypothetical protein
LLKSIKALLAAIFHFLTAAAFGTVAFQKNFSSGHDETFFILYLFDHCFQRAIKIDDFAALTANQMLVFA